MIAGKSSHRIFVVDDDPTGNAILHHVLTADGHQVRSILDGGQVLPLVEELSPDLLLLDIGLPNVDGVQILKSVRARTPPIPVIMVTAESGIPVVVELTKLGAFDYFTKPVDIDRLLNSVHNALALSRRDREVSELRAKVVGARLFEDILGRSPALVRAVETARRVLDTSVPVLIRGETGTGKEVFAKSMHYNGPRREAPFVAVNCAALSETLLESELFGHERGAFTGAVARRIGRFEQADGGTLFLDEIGDMPASTQVKLLRVLQERTFERVGGTEPVKVDVRLLSATHQDLEALIAQKRFREDLFYRINTVTISLPALRDRLDDIPPLAERFLAEFASEVNKKIEGFTPEALALLRGCPWKGNLRELKNVVERAVLLSTGTCIDAADLPLRTGPPSAAADGPGSPGLPPVPSGAPVNLTETVERYEKEMIRLALERRRGVKSEAARDLGLTSRMIAYKIAKYGL